MRNVKIKGKSNKTIFLVSLMLPDERSAYACFAILLILVHTYFFKSQMNFGMEELQQNVHKKDE